MVDDPVPSYSKEIENRTKENSKDLHRSGERGSIVPISTQPEIYQFFKRTRLPSSEGRRISPHPTSRFKRRKRQLRRGAELPKIRRSRLSNYRKRRHSQDTENLQTVKECWEAMGRIQRPCKKRKILTKRRRLGSPQKEPKSTWNQSSTSSHFLNLPLQAKPSQPLDDNKQQSSRECVRTSPRLKVLQSKNMNRCTHPENIHCNSPRRKRRRPADWNCGHSTCSNTKAPSTKLSKTLVSDKSSLSKPWNRSSSIGTVSNSRLNEERVMENQLCCTRTPSPNSTTNAEVEMSRKGSGQIPSPRCMLEQDGLVRSVLDSNRYSGSSSLKKQNQIRLPRLEVKNRKFPNDTRRKISFQDRPEGDDNVVNVERIDEQTPSSSLSLFDEDTASTPLVSSQETQETPPIVNNNQKMENLKIVDEYCNLKIVDEYCSSTEDSGDDRPESVCFDTAVWDAYHERTAVEVLQHDKWIKCVITQINAWAAHVQPYDKSSVTEEEFEVTNSECIRVLTNDSSTMTTSPKKLNYQSHTVVPMESMNFSSGRKSECPSEKMEILKQPGNWLGKASAPYKAHTQPEGERQTSTKVTKCKSAFSTQTIVDRKPINQQLVKANQQPKLSIAAPEKKPLRMHTTNIRSSRSKSKRSQKDKSKKRTKTVSNNIPTKSKTTKKKIVKINTQINRKEKKSGAKSIRSKVKRDRSKDGTVPAGGTKRRQMRVSTDVTNRPPKRHKDSFVLEDVPIKKSSKLGQALNSEAASTSVPNHTDLLQLLYLDKSYHAQNTLMILKQMPRNSESLSFQREMAKFISRIGKAEVLLRKKETARLRKLNKETEHLRQVKKSQSNKRKRVRFCCHDFTTQQPPMGVDTYKPYENLLHHLYHASQSAVKLFMKGCVRHENYVLDFFNRLEEKVESGTLLKQNHDAAVLLLNEIKATLQKGNQTMYPFQSRVSTILSSLVRYEMRLIFNCSEWFQDCPEWVDQLGGYILPPGAEFDETCSMMEQGIEFMPYHAAEISINLLRYYDLNQNEENKLCSKEDKLELINFFADILEVFQEHPVMLGQFIQWGDVPSALPKFERFLYDCWSRLRVHLRCIKKAHCEDLYAYLPLLDFEAFLEKFPSKRNELLATSEVKQL